MATLPSPSDYATSEEFFAAHDAYCREVSIEQDAALLARIAEAGGRTTTCPDGYGPFDSCPVHD